MSTTGTASSPQNNICGFVKESTQAETKDSICSDIDEIIKTSKNAQTIFSKHVSTWEFSDIEKIIRIFGERGLDSDEVIEAIETLGIPLWLKYSESYRKDFIENIVKCQPEIEDNKKSTYPYSVTPDGVFKEEIKTKKDDSGELVTYAIQKLITQTPCKIIALGSNIDTKEFLYKISITDIKNRVKEVWKTPSDLLTRQGIKSFYSDGLVLNEALSGDMINYFEKAISAKKADLPEEIVASRGGWKNNDELFIIGNRGYTKDGVQEVVQQDNSAAEYYTPKGNITNWIEGVKDFIKYDAIRFKMYVSCSALIMKLIRQKSFVNEQCVGSGHLKTVSAMICASMFGDSETLPLSADSTKAGIESFVSTNTDLPVFLEETTTIKPEFQNLIYTIANGKGRGKMRPGENGFVYQAASTWRTCVLTTGELPILNENANLGQFARTVPLYEGVEDIIAQDVIGILEQTIAENYGLVAELYIKKIFELKGSLMDIFNYYMGKFPITEDITSERVKKLYATIATAGYILELVLSNAGAEKQDPFLLCEKYFIQNVLESSRLTPNYIKALLSSYSWYSRNEQYFQDSAKWDDERITNHELYGWVRDDSICFDPEKLKEHLKKESFNYEGVIQDWTTEDILITKEQKKKNGKTIIRNKIQITPKAGEKQVQVIKVPFDNIFKYLNNTEEADTEVQEEKPQECLNQCDTDYNSSLKNFLSQNYPSKKIDNVGRVAFEFVGLPNSRKNDYFHVIGLDQIKQDIEEYKEPESKIRIVKDDKEALSILTGGV